MADLKIAETLILPMDAVVQRLAFIGTSNSGKTYGATKLAELMWHAGLQFVALDVMGIWYGLRIDGSGEGPGVPITIFGGRHGDVPVTEHDGEVVAQLIFDHGISAIVDISEFEDDAQKNRFAARFAQRIYLLKKRKPGAIHLFLEEAHEYLPQNVQGGESQMLHVWNRVWKQGGNFGIGGSIITQRPQDVNKKALELSACVFAFNTTGSNAVDAMRKWMGAQETSGLQSLQQGECVVWSPSWLQVLEKVKIAPKTTFHARFDPSKAQPIDTAQRSLAPVEVATLRQALAETVKAEEENDPRALKARIAELESHSKATGKDFLSSSEIDGIVAEEVARATKPLEERNAHLEWIIGEVNQIAQRLGSITSIEKFSGHTAKAERSLEIPEDLKLPISETPAVEPADPAAAPSLTPKHQAMLDTLAQLEAIGGGGADRRLLAALTSQSPKSSAYEAKLRDLRTLGYVVTPGPVELTRSGRAQAVRPLRPPTLADLHRRWKGFLGRSAGRCLDVIVRVHPRPVERKDLAKLAGISPTSSSFDAALRELRTYGLATGSKEISATALLFPEGLR
jgi:hypothetical protein